MENQNQVCLYKYRGAVINLILDPILIFGFFGLPALGIVGAAISSVIGQFVGMIIGLIIIVKSSIFKLTELTKIKIKKDIIIDIYKVGIPTILLESVTSFITMFLNKILGSFSSTAISVWGIYCQLQRFVIIIVYGFNYGMIPIIAYNWGAKNNDRVTKTIKLFIKIAIVVTIFGQIIFMLFTKQIIQIYDVSEDLLKIAIPAFRILSLGFVFAGVSLVFASTFQAFGNGVYSLIVNLSRQIIFSLPFIFVLKNVLGINGIWISFVIAEFITLIIAICLFLRNKKKLLIQNMVVFKT